MGRDWNVSKGAVRDFFKLLHGENMIFSENLKITTRITVCNYNNYKHTTHEGNAKETPRVRKQ